MLRQIILLPFRLARSLARMIKRTWSIVSVVVVVTLLATNVLTLVSSLAYRLASSAIDMVSEGASLRSRTDAELKRVKADLDSSELRLSSLDDDLSQAQRQRAELQDRASTSQLQLDTVEAERARLDTRVSQIETDLQTERLRAANLRSELAEARSETTRAIARAQSDRAQREAFQIDLDNMRTNRSAQAEMIDIRTRAIERRSRNLVAREVASMPLESIPWFGIATIVAVTGLELKDLCDTSKDMQAIREAFGLTDPMLEGGNEVCGQDIWTTSELRAWIADGKEGQVEERCRRLVEDIGLPLPDECPALETLPPMPQSIADAEASELLPIRPVPPSMIPDASQPTVLPPLPPRISTD